MSEYLRPIADAVAMTIGYLVIFIGILFGVWATWWETRDRIRRRRRRRESLYAWRARSK